MNRNGLCRLCLLSIRTTDKTWLAGPAPQRPTQLFLLLDGVQITNARGLNRGLSAVASPASLPPRNPTWVCAALEQSTVSNDPTICPALPSGQLVLMRPPRTFTVALATRITGRSATGFAAAAEVARNYNAELARSTRSRSTLLRILGLVLAAAEAEGYLRVPQEWLADAPLSESITEVLRRAELLAAGNGPRPQPRHRSPSGFFPGEPRSCTDCHCWGLETLCSGCRWWRSTRHLGDCSRCLRTHLHVGLLDDGDEMFCRACTVVLRFDGLHALPGGATQLSLGGPFAPRLHTPEGMLGYRPTRWKAQDLARARRPEPPPVSAHLVDPNQPELFTLQRNWLSITVDTVLPSLTPAAREVIAAVTEHAATSRWATDSVRAIVRSLEILLGWLGAEAPIREDDVLALRTTHVRTTGTRVIAFLAERNLLVPSESRSVSAHQRWVTARIATLNQSIAAELHIWVQVMLGHGRRRRHPRSWRVIRNYLAIAMPTLTGWSADHTSLREITHTDIRTEFRDLTGATAHTLRTGLRSIFVALKQERVIFRDPTRGIRLARVENLPTQLREDQLRGLINRVDRPFDKLVIALAAIHALGNQDLRNLTLADVDTAQGRLIVRRTGRSHIVYLDELTLGLLLQWLDARISQWPTSTNPHLLTTTLGAVALHAPAVSHATISNVFRTVGVQGRHIRFDRILHEARTTADPIHLMRVFGICANTAMRYLHAAHPERAAAPPAL
ncbi:hypothetical protein ACFVKB_40610 [Rhodococcus sp. NPDC127530]|uniref:hypothetical protein n=1 Tax=unclassified Rhodococcus (in: high G+C Gram-positive bacteria) TaxID=192944 RepID=UPI003636AD29